MIPKRDIVILFVVTILSLGTALSLRSTSQTGTSLLVETLVDKQSLRFDAVQEITVDRDNQTFVFSLIDGSWNQVTPFPQTMDPSSMTALIESVQGLQVLGTLTKDTSDDVLGLDAESNYIELFDGIDRVRVILGRKTLGGRGYAKLQKGEPVLVGQSLHRRAIDMDHRLWRDVRLFPDFAIDGELIERDVQGDRLVLKRIQGRWEMLEPVPARLNQDMLTEWVGKLAAARVGMYVIDEPTNLTPFGLEVPTATFATTTGNGVKRTLLIGGRVAAGSQDRYVMFDGSPVVFRMTMDALNQLFPVPEMFVDSTGSSVSKFDVKQVIIRTGGKEIQVTRNLDRWVGENDIPVDSAEINSLLHWILEGNPVSVAISPFPLNLEIATVTLVGYDLSPLDTVRIALDESEQWILENGDNVLRLHPSESGKALAPFQN
jgi:hypothetical protein